MTETPTETVNGSAPAPPERSIEQRVGDLEQQMARIAAAVSGLMLQQMQPQMQQGILAQLLNTTPPAEPTADGAL